jgi:putative ABC transport system permease protein
MFAHIVQIALRSLSKNKGFTLLNILGLTLGISICLLIVFYVADELSFDRYNIRADRIFRVNTDTKSGAASSSRAISAPAVGAALMNNFPEVEKTVRLLPAEEFVKRGSDFVLENKVVYCDPTLFDLFTLPMVEGDPKTALTEPNAVVITESTAKRYFNTTRVVGRTLTLLGDSNLSTIHKITGVIKDIPPQSHFHFDLFLSMLPVRISRIDNFAALFPFTTYLLVKPGTDYKKLEAKFPDLMRKKIPFLNTPGEQGDYIRINLTPLTAIHLQSSRTNELGANGNIQYIRIFSAIALFILLIACINFMNLSTARSSDRAREIGVRKILGSRRRYLIAQFLSESVIIALVAAVLSVLAAWASLPLFNRLAGKDLVIVPQTLGWLSVSLLIILIVVGVIAGAYPAFFLSAFRPMDVLKGKLSRGFKGIGLRSVLVVLQFSISIFLIIGTLVIYSQLHYIQNKNLGFNRNQVVVVKNMNALESSKAKILKQEVKRLPGVLNATLSSFLPTGDRRWINYIGTKSNNIETQYWPVDEDYLSTMGMQLAEGRDFSKQLSTDSSGMVINETAAKMLGFPEDALNKKVYYGGAEKEYHIIGILKDFNFSSLRDNIDPVVMMMMTPFERRKEGDEADNLIVRVSSPDLPVLLEEVGSKWKGLSPRQQFEYSFMDEDFDAMYRSEQRMGKIFVLFAALAVIIACLGLFGLAAYAAGQLAREISIRKVLGASAGTIIGMLSRDFIKLVFIAILISFPLAWLYMTTWLQDFAYRVSIHWWIPGIAGFSALIIAFITISFQTIKAANTNPVKNLRSE